MSDASFAARLTAEWVDSVTRAAAPPASSIVAQAGPERASRTAVLAEIEDVRLTVEELAASLDEVGAARLATRRWSIRDVLAHLASWAWQTCVEIERLRDGEAFDETIHFGVTGPHAWNQRHVEERSGRSLAALLAEIDAGHERLIALVIEMPEADLHRIVDLPRTIGEPAQPWRMPMSSMILMTCRHARLHLRGIERLMRAG
jgi:hypothetical protein